MYFEENIFLDFQENLMSDFHGTFAMGGNCQVKKELTIPPAFFNSTEQQLFTSGEDHHNRINDNNDDVHMMFSNDFIKGGPSLFNPQNSFDKEDASVINLDASSQRDNMMLGPMDGDIIFASMGSVQSEDDDIRNRDRAGFSNGASAAETVRPAAKGFQSPRRPRLRDSEDGLEQELQQLLYSPPQSEAGSDETGGGGLFDVTTLLSATGMKTPDGMCGTSASSSSQQSLMAERQALSGGMERLGEAGRPLAPPFPDWQLTPPPDGHQLFIKEEQNWWVPVNDRMKENNGGKKLYL